MVVEKYDTLVASIAYEYHNRYRMVETEDIRQELWIWFLEHPRKVTAWEKLDSKESTKLYARSLRNCAKDFCQKEKAQLSGYHVSDNYYYDKQFLEAILPAIYTGDRKNVSEDDLSVTKTKKVASEGNNWLAIVADIDLALSKLSQEQQSILFERYATSAEITAMALSKNISPDAMRMRINRAINSLQNRLGGVKPIKERDFTNDETQETTAPESEPEADES